MEISIHELKHKIDIDIISRLDDVKKLDHIIMIREFLWR